MLETDDPGGLDPHAGEVTTSEYHRFLAEHGIDRVKAKALAILAVVEGHNLTVVRLWLEEQRLKLEERRLGRGLQMGCVGPV